MDRSLAMVRPAALETWDDHIEAWHHYSRQADDSLWGKAAVAASLKVRFGDEDEHRRGRPGEKAIEKFAEEVGQAANTIWQIAQVFERYAYSERSEYLSFNHHLVAMYAPDPLAALALAEAGTTDPDGTPRENARRWTTRELRQHVKRARELPPAPPPKGKYSTIVIDPPWQIEKIDRDVRPKQGAMDYPMMSLDEIRELPVATLADVDAHLYLWTTHKYLPDALALCEAWGFRYQCLMTWVKNVGFTPFSWMYSTEHVVFARRGSLDLIRKGLRLDFSAPVTRHSEKPEVFYDLVRQASPEPRLDMFARQEREGFTAWGNEVQALAVAG